MGSRAAVVVEDCQAVDAQTRSWAIPALAGALVLYAVWGNGSGRGRGARGRLRKKGAETLTEQPSG